MGLNKGKTSVIRPPGAVDEKDFLALCIRCGECMKVCKTHGLTWMHNNERYEDPSCAKAVCVGCGFCEKVCPVLGTSAIVVEGIQPQTKVKRPKETLAKNFLPETLGDWKRISCPNVYEGKEKLYEYIDAVIAEYRPNTSSESFKLMLIKYPHLY